MNNIRTLLAGSNFLPLLLIIAISAGCAMGSNRRAEVRIDGGVTALAAQPATPKTAIRVRGVELRLHCPAVYTGKADLQKMSQRYCQSTVNYAVAVENEQTLKFAFAYSGHKNLVWTFTRTNAQGNHAILDAGFDESFEVGNGLRFPCAFCPPALRTQRMSVIPQSIGRDLEEIHIHYRQAMTYAEEGDGHWVQGFTYELWPLAEWDSENELKVTFALALEARPGFLGVGFKNDNLSCNLREAQKIIPITLSGGETVEKIMRPSEQTGIERAEGRYFSAELKLKKAPQQLVCSWY